MGPSRTLARLHIIYRGEVGAIGLPDDYQRDRIAIAATNHLGGLVALRGRVHAANYRGQERAPRRIRTVPRKQFRSRGKGSLIRRVLVVAPRVCHQGKRGETRRVRYVFASPSGVSIEALPACVRNWRRVCTVWLVQ